MKGREILGFFMDKDRLQKQLDILWDKVQGRVEPSSAEPWKGQPDFASAFDQVQQDLQAESLQLLKTRFEKEKIYWENLLAAKEEILARLRKEVQEEQLKNQELKSKLQEM